MDLSNVCFFRYIVGKCAKILIKTPLNVDIIRFLSNLKRAEKMFEISMNFALIHNKTKPLQTLVCRDLFSFFKIKFVK